MIHNCDGIIQNNIIEFNQGGIGGAFNSCDGLIQNNLIRGNEARGGVKGFDYNSGLGGAFFNCNGTIRNNTIVDNYYYNVSWENGQLVTRFGGAGGLVRCKGQIINNIITHTTLTQALEFDDNSTPTYCLFRKPQAGQGNITGDPGFTDPKNGDFRLKPDSPAIGAGAAQSGLKYDLQGFPRASGPGTPGRGDGSGTGIGAYEVPPRPVAVWIPYGGPPEIREGEAVAVSWQLDPPAGSNLRLRLFKGGAFVAYLGQFTKASGTETLTLPASLASGSDYSFQGYTPTTPVYGASTPRFTITGSRMTAAEPARWRRYE